MPNPSKQPKKPKQPPITVFDIHDLPTIADHVESVLSMAEKMSRKEGGINTIAVAWLEAVFPIVASETQRARFIALAHNLGVADRAADKPASSTPE